MMINPEERRDLKKANKRLIIFLALVFLIDGFICFLFYKYTNMHPVLNGFLIIVITTILYIAFMMICNAIDKRKAKRLVESGKRDPFSKEGKLPQAQESNLFSKDKNKQKKKKQIKKEMEKAKQEELERKSENADEE